MTVPTETALASLAWTGVETSFSPGFRAQAASHVKVLSVDETGDEDLLELGVHYSVFLASDGTVEVLPLAMPPAPRTLQIHRDTPATQGTDFQNLGQFVPSIHTQLHDAAAMRDGERKRDIARTLRAPFGEIMHIMPTAAERAGHFLGFDSDGRPVAQALAESEFGVTDAAAEILDDTSLSAILVTLGVSFAYFSTDPQWDIDRTAEDTAAVTTAKFQALFDAAIADGNACVIIAPGIYRISEGVDGFQEWASALGDAAIDLPGNVGVGIYPPDTDDPVRIVVIAHGAQFIHEGDGKSFGAYRLAGFEWHGGYFRGDDDADDDSQPSALCVARCVNPLVNHAEVHSSYRGFFGYKNANAVFYANFAEGCRYFGHYMSAWIDVDVPGHAGLKDTSGENLMRDCRGFGNGTGSFFVSSARAANCWSVDAAPSISPTGSSTHFYIQDGRAQIEGGGFWETSNQNSGATIDGVLISPTGTFGITTLAPSRSRVANMQCNGGRSCIYLDGAANVDIVGNACERYYLQGIVVVSYLSGSDARVVRDCRVFDNDVRPRLSTSTVVPSTHEVRAGIHCEGYNSVECDVQVYNNTVNYNARGADKNVTQPHYDIYAAALTETSRIEHNLTLGSGGVVAPVQKRRHLPIGGRLTLSSSDVHFLPWHGRLAPFGAIERVIPSVGVKLAPAGLSAGLKYIYGQFSIGTISRIERASNVVTVTLADNHALVVGSGVTVEIVPIGAIDATFAGDFLVTAIPSATKFSYANTGSDVADVGALGRITAITLSASATGTAVDAAGHLVKSDDASKLWLGTSTVDGGPNFTEVTDRRNASATEVAAGTEAFKAVTPASLAPALALKAPLASPAFTGNPTAPTASPGDNDTSIATTAFVAAAITTAINAVLNGVSSVFDTLAEIATELGLKAPLASPTFTGTPAAPTASADTDTTQIATTAFVLAQDRKLAINTQTDSYTLALTDAGKAVEMNKGSANTLTVPPNASVAFPTGTIVKVVQYGAGQTTIAAGAGVTINSAGARLKLTQQHSDAFLYKRGTNEWQCSGDLTA